MAECLAGKPNGPYGRYGLLRVSDDIDVPSISYG